jgi:hypothetical protein
MNVARLMIDQSSCHQCSPFSYLHLDADYTFTSNQAFKTSVVVKTLSYYPQYTKLWD